MQWLLKIFKASLISLESKLKCKIQVQKEEIKVAWMRRLLEWREREFLHKSCEEDWKDKDNVSCMKKATVLVWCTPWACGTAGCWHFVCVSRWNTGTHHKFMGSACFPCDRKRGHFHKMKLFNALHFALLLCWILKISLLIIRSFRIEKQ